MKPGQFSFLGDEFENIFQYSDLFLPGIERITTAYYSPERKELRVLSRKRDEEMDSDYGDFLAKPESRVAIQKFRSNARQYSWIRKDDLPFELPVKKSSIQTIFTELENVILVLHFPNEVDGLNDLLFIYFNQNLGNFGLNRSDKPLSAENKSIIGHLLYHQFNSILRMNHENLKLLRTFNQGVMGVIRDNAILKDQLQQVRMNYSESMVNLAQQFLADYSARTDTSYALTREALEKIRNYHGNVKHLPAILKNAIIFTENLMMEQPGEIVRIHDFSLDFDSYQVPAEQDELTKKIDSRQSRAMLLLDRLEKSASSLKSRSLQLTGANVGKNLSPPISAPAITDALSKNKILIRQLISRHPDKWEIIRKEFRPLLNILREEDIQLAEEESA